MDDLCSPLLFPFEIVFLLDPLTQTIALLRPRALLWKQMEARGRWALRFPGHGGAVFCLVVCGQCVFQVAGRQPRSLGEGDFLLLTTPPGWTLGDSEAAVPMDHGHVHASPETPVTYVGDGSAGPVTQVLGGYFAFHGSDTALLKGIMPAVAEIRSPTAGAARLRGVLDLIGDEASSDRPGQSLVLERLLEVMLVEAIRHQCPHPVGTRQGLVAGLADPPIAAALRAFHGDVQRRWTVAELAKVAGQSRSVFAARFTRTVGLPPIDYLLRWRMALAKDALRRGRRALADVAQGCGYQSVSAFSAAFSRTVGCSPSKYATEEGHGIHDHGSDPH